jgi:hypothetical protein
VFRLHARSFPVVSATRFAALSTVDDVEETSE